MFKLLFFLNIINISIAEPIYNDYDDDLDENYNFIINFYNSSDCSNNYIKSINYYLDCDINNHNSCCQDVIDYYNLTKKYNLTEECSYSYNDDYYITYQCTEVNNEGEFTLIFTIFYIIFSIIFLCFICYCFINNPKIKNKNIESEERKLIIDKNFNNTEYYMSHFNC